MTCSLRRYKSTTTNKKERFSLVRGSFDKLKVIKCLNLTLYLTNAPSYGLCRYSFLDKAIFFLHSINIVNEQ